MIYTKRLTEPSRDDKNFIVYYKGGYNYCIEKSNGFVLPNCVAYCWGRWRELLGTYHNLSRNDAELWYPNKGDGYVRGQTPKLGAVICWEGKGELAGHVAIVEHINEDGSILTSNSAYSGAVFYLKTLYPPYYNMGSSYIFQGFIYPPVEFKEDKPEPQPVEDVVTYVYKAGDTFGQVILDLGLATSHGLWGPDGDVAYYSAQLNAQGIMGNIPVGTEIKLTKRKD